MVELIRTDSGNKDFEELEMLLDADLHIRDADDHSFFAQFEKGDPLQYVVVAYQYLEAVGCGAIKPYAPNTAEVKRMFVLPEFRGLGIADALLQELEQWATELGFYDLILETGKAQPEAIRLYGKNGYTIIANFGPYANLESSVCMKKELGHGPL